MSITGLLAWAIGACLVAALVFSFWWPGLTVAVLLAAAGMLAGWLGGSWMIGVRDARREARRNRGAPPPGPGGP